MRGVGGEEKQYSQDPHTRIGAKTMNLSHVWKKKANKQSKHKLGPPLVDIGN